MILRKAAFFTTFLFFSSYSFVEAQTDIAGIPNRGKDAAAIYVDAVKARMLDDAKQEEDLLKEVIKLKPEEASPYYDLAKLYQKQRKHDQAEQQIEKATKLDNENIWFKVAQAEILEAQSKTEQAAAIYKELAEKEKFNKEYIYNAARLYETAGKYKEAIALIDLLLQKTGNDEYILIQKQQLYLRINDLEGAAKVAQQLIDINPREGRYYTNLAALYDNNGQPEKAFAVYEQALKQFPEDAMIQYGLSQYYKNRKDILKYEEYIKKAILNPELEDEKQVSILFSYLQDINADSSKKEQGVILTSKLAALHPKNAEIINLYGEVLLDNGEADKAQDQFKQAVVLDPSRFATWQRLLFGYTDRKYADSLVKYSEKAMRYFPNQALVHYLNGIGHYNKKNYTSAIKSINRAIDLQPEDNKPLLADMYSILGDVYNSAEKNTESDAAYEKALQLSPNNPSVLNNYAYYLSVRGIKLDLAEKMSQKSLEIRPDESTFLDTYGWILYKQGNYKKAEEYIQRALDKNPDADGTLYDHLGDIYYKLNEKEKAVEFWKKAKQKGTDNPQIDKKIQDQKLYE